MCFLKRLRIYALMLCFLLFSSFPSLTHAGEYTSTLEGREYILTEMQYQKLVNNLSELAKINRTSQQELKAAREQLKTANAKLLEAEKRLKELENTYVSLKVEMTEQESLLQNANKSLQVAEAEFKAKQKKTRWQRNTAYTIAACALYAAIKR